MPIWKHGCSGRRAARRGAGYRLFVDAVLWMARGCAPWRDLPPELGKWASVHSRFRRWTLSGVWESLFNTLADDPDFEYVLIDATISKVHADAAGAKEPAPDLIRGGLRLTVSAARKAA